MNEYTLLIKAVKPTFPFTVKADTPREAIAKWQEHREAVKVDDERYGEHNYHPEGRVEDIIVLTFVPRSEWAEA